MSYWKSLAESRLQDIRTLLRMLHARGVPVAHVDPEVMSTSQEWRKGRLYPEPLERAAQALAERFGTADGGLRECRQIVAWIYEGATGSEPRSREDPYPFELEDPD